MTKDRQKLISRGVHSRKTISTLGKNDEFVVFLHGGAPQPPQVRQWKTVSFSTEGGRWQHLAQQSKWKFALGIFWKQESHSRAEIQNLWVNSAQIPGCLITFHPHGGAPRSLVKKQAETRRGGTGYAVDRWTTQAVNCTGTLVRGVFFSKFLYCFWSTAGSLWLRRTDCMNWCMSFYIGHLSIHGF